MWILKLSVFAQINLAPVGENDCAINQSVLHGNIRFVFLKELFLDISDMNEHIYTIEKSLDETILLEFLEIYRNRLQN